MHYKLVSALHELRVKHVVLFLRRNTTLCVHHYALCIMHWNSALE